MHKDISEPVQHTLSSARSTDVHLAFNNPRDIQRKPCAGNKITPKNEELC